MRKYIIVLLLLISSAVQAQLKNSIYGKDVVIETRDSSSAELTIKNSTRNVLGYFKNIGGGKGQYVIIPQTDITGLADSLLARYTKTEADGRFKSISYIPSWLELTGVPTNFSTTYALSNDIKDSILARLRKTDTTLMLQGYKTYFPRTSLSITTTGTSGAATYNNLTGVFNIPQYQSALTNPVTGSGTINTILKFTGTSTISNSSITDNGTDVTTNSTLNVNNKLNVNYNLGVTSVGENVVASIVRGTATDAGLQLGYHSNGTDAIAGSLRSSNNLPLYLGTTGVRTSIVITNTGNILFGTNLNNGLDRIQVSGSGRFSTSLTLGGGGISNFLAFNAGSAWPILYRNTSSGGLVVDIAGINSSGSLLSVKNLGSSDLMFVSSAGDIVTNSTTASTSVGTGALRSSGGLGVAGAGFIGSSLVAGNTNSSQNKIGKINLGFSGSGYPAIGYNIRYSSTSNSYQYDVSDFSWMIDFGNGGVLRFRSASSGTVGNSITYNDLFTLSTSTATFAGNIISTATTASTNNTTGALVVGGGIGVAGAINVGNTTTGANINARSSSYGANGVFQAFGTDGLLKLQMGALSATSGYIYTGTGNSLAFLSGNATALTLGSDQSALFSKGVTAQRVRSTSLVVNKDSIPRTTTRIFAMMLDTTGVPGTNIIERRDISQLHAGPVGFDTTSRELTITLLNGSSTSVVIPRGTASVASGITALSNSRTGNFITVSGDNGSSTTFNIRDADSTNTMKYSDSSTALSGYERKGYSLLLRDTAVAFNNYRLKSTLVENSDLGSNIDFSKLNPATIPVFNQNTTGNAATVTNGVYTTGSYANPTWVTSLAWSKITGAPDFLTSYTETDPTISAWAKATTKPTYSYAEITGTPTTWVWANLTGVPTIFATNHASSGDIKDSLLNKVTRTGSYADPSWITSLNYSKLTGTVPTWNQNTTGNAATVTNGVYTTGTYANPAWITSLAWSKITGAPTFLTSYTETDPTVSTWAKAATKPTYSYAEITGTPATWAWASLSGVPTFFNTNYTNSGDIKDSLLNKVSRNGSYADPAWLTTLNYAKLVGTVPIWNQNTTGTAANVTATSNATLITLSNLTTAAGGTFGSYAYRSSGLAEISGANFTGDINIAKDNPKLTLTDNVGGAINNYSISSNLGFFNLRDETAGTTPMSYGGGIFNYQGSSTTSGNVGIGISPTQKLHVASNQPRIMVEATTNTNNAGIFFQGKNSVGTSQAGGIYYIPGTNAYLLLSGDNINPHLNINSIGNILIKTTVDNGLGDALQVNGSGVFNNELRTLSTTASTSTTTGAIRSAGGLGVAGAGNFGGGITSSGTINANSGGSQIRINNGGTEAGIFMSSGNSLLKIADWATGTKGLEINISTGSANFSSTLKSYGFQQSISTKTSNYTLTATDYTVIFYVTTANLTATLPAGVEGQIFNIIKTGSGVASHSLTINPNGSNTIDGNSSYVIYSCSAGSYTFQFTGGNWYLIAAAYNSPC